MNAEPDNLRHQERARLAKFGDRVGQTFAGLRDCLAHAEGRWDEDDLATAFVREFKSHADQLLANVRAMEESLRDTAAGIMDTTCQFKVQDKDGAARAGDIAEGDLDIDGRPTLPQLCDSAGTLPSAGAQPPGTPNPAAPSAAAGDPV
ncbi:hypothetical protein ACFZC5_34280 [Nocardia gamkensis]|uniref:hypothetical protein n=1 Tax=Nocardia gamkensis TaxID=352869 RepID=UPI0036ED291D